MASIFLASGLHTKRFDDTNASIREVRDDINRRFDEVVRRLERIETKQGNHVDEKTSPSAG